MKESHTTTIESYTRVYQSWEARVCMDESLLNSCVLVKKRSVAGELRSESLYENFLNSHDLVKRERELHESWWELTSESLYESFLNSHVLVKR